jgi:cephalosporin hydroxylase
MPSESTVLEALRGLGTKRRFFGPEYSDLLKVARELFYQTIGRITIIPWFEFGAMQCPGDYMSYLECVLIKKPRTIIETGTAGGGGTLFWLEVLKRVHGDSNVRVITIEINQKQISYDVYKHPEITSLIGSTTDTEIAKKVQELVAQSPGPVMVTLDSDHGAEHVAREMAIYSDLVSLGQYMIVQDTFFGLYWGGNLTGEQQRDLHDGVPGSIPFDYSGCPLGAVEAFLSCDSRFEVDMYPQRWILTQCPFGFLLKKSS